MLHSVQDLTNHLFKKHEIVLASLLGNNFPHLSFFFKIKKTSHFTCVSFRIKFISAWFCSKLITLWSYIITFLKLVYDNNGVRYSHVIVFPMLSLNHSISLFLVQITEDAARTKNQPP